MGAKWCTGWCSEHKGVQLVAVLQMPNLGYMARECTTPAKTLNQDGDIQGDVVKPPPTTISKFTTFLSGPKQKPSKGSE